VKSFALALEELLTVAAAVLDAGGILPEANAGFLRLLPTNITAPIGAKVSRFFIQPNFRTLLVSMGGAPSVGYRGLMTIGDPNGTTRTLLGRAWQSEEGIRILAEYDIAELEMLAGAMLDLNRESSVAQHALTRENVTMKQRERFRPASSASTRRYIRRRKAGATAWSRRNTEQARQPRNQAPLPEQVVSTSGCKLRKLTAYASIRPGIKDVVTIFARQLGLIHRLIGLAQQLVGIDRLRLRV